VQRHLTILLLQGVSADHSTLWRVAEDLADLGVEVIAPDLLGLGGRPAPPDVTVEIWP
jgi:dienelactone hydrolase